MVTEDVPKLKRYDHEAMAIDGNYNDLSIDEVLSEFVAHRIEFIEFFKGLTEEGWKRGGIHPERDVFTMVDAAMQVGLHDTNHIEQISRIMFESGRSAD